MQFPNMFGLPGFPPLPGLAPNMMMAGFPGAGFPGMQPKPGADAGRPNTRQQGLNRKRDRQDRSAEDDKEDVPSVTDSPALLCLYDEERRLRDQLEHRRLDVRDSLKPSDRHKRKMRLTVTNTHVNQQPLQQQSRPSSSSVSPQEPPSWTLYIHGRILEASDPSGAAVLAPGAAPLTPNVPVSSVPRGQLSDFVRRIEVQLDPALYPGEDKCVWDRALHSNVGKDMFEVKRMGSQPTTAKVTVWLDWRPERFKLPLPLATALGVRYDTRSRVLQAMSQYVAKNHLNDPKQPGWVRLPLPLAQLLAPEELKEQQQQQQPPPTAQNFSRAILPYEALLQRVSDKLEPMPPLELTHSIQLSGPPKAAHAYDLDFDFAAPPLGSPLQQDNKALAKTPGSAASAVAPPQSSEYLLGKLESVLAPAGGEEAAGNEVLSRLASELSKAERLYHEAKRRRTVLCGFMQAPADFIHGLAASQARELRVSRGQQQATAYTVAQQQNGKVPPGMFEQSHSQHASMYATEFESKRRSELFKEPWVEDAVLADRVFLSSRMQRAQSMQPQPMGPSIFLQ